MIGAYMSIEMQFLLYPALFVVNKLVDACSGHAFGCKDIDLIVRSDDDTQGFPFRTANDGIFDAVHCSLVWCRVDVWVFVCVGQRDQYLGWINGFVRSFDRHGPRDAICNIGTRW